MRFSCVCKSAAPCCAPRYAIEARGLELELPLRDGEPLRLQVPHLVAGYSDAVAEGYLTETLAYGLGGQMRLSGTFSMTPYTFDLRLATREPLELAPLLPPKVVDAVGSRLTGELHVFGDGQVQHLDELELSLGRAKLSGGLVLTSEALWAQGLRVRLGSSALTLRGRIDTAAEQLDLRYAVDSRDLPRWLGYVGVPEVARALSGSGRIRGSYTDPRVTAALRLSGVPIVDTVAATLSYAGGQIALRRAETAGLGGTVSASGVLDLNARPKLRNAQLRASGLDLGRLPLLGPYVTGRLDATLSASGSPDRLRLQASASTDALTVAGDRFGVVSLEASTADGAAELALHLERDAGGVLDLQAVVDQALELGGQLRVRGLPLQSLPLGAKSPAESPVGGTLNAEFALSGTARAPLAEGVISVARGWVGSAFLGVAELRVEPAGAGLMRVRGRVMQGKAEVEGTVGTAAPYPANLQITLRRVELDQFAPELAARYGVRGWVSGTLSLDTPLEPTGQRLPSGQLRLTEAVLVVDNDDSAGRPAPLRLRNAGAVDLDFDGSTLMFVEPATFDGPGGSFTVQGSARVDALALHLAGNVALAMLEPYARDTFDEISGSLEVAVDVTGSLAEPRLQALIDISELAVRPAGQDAVVSVPAGRIQLTNDQIAVTGIDVNVVDAFSGERATLTVAGGVALDDFEPAMWALNVEGQLAGKMLLVAAPRVFSQASGTAQLSLAIIGAGDTPDIHGSIEFDTARPFTITPRGLRRELTFTTGALSFTESRVQFDNVGGLIDDEGRFIIGLGSDCEEATPVRCSEVSLANWQPVEVDVTVSADGLPFRVPKTLELTLNLVGVRIVGGAEGVDIAGTIEVVDGRYMRDFNLGEALRPTTGPSVPEEPFYEQVPMLANANLDLALDVRAFFVQNNIANIELGGAIAVAGTPAEPRLDGEIQVEQGAFKLQGMRARFSRTRGSVAFSGFKRFPEDTPVLDITSESDYRDPSGQDHLITLDIEGTLSALQWELGTSAGLNKAQTITLLVSGRTPDEVRRSIGDQAPGRDPRRIDPSTAPTESYSDQLLKDLAGDFISLLVEDTLRNITSLDVARLEIGTGSIGFHGEKRVFKNLRFLGDLEQTLRGRTYSARGELRLSDALSVEGEILNKDFADEVEQDVSDERIGIVYRFLLP